MLESEAYMTYHAYAIGDKTPKPKSTKMKADSESSPKTKPTQASKGKRIKTLAKGDKPAKKKQSTTKSKGQTILSEVAFTEAEQMKIALKRSKIQTYSSHASGSGVGVDIQSKVPDEQQQTVSDNDGDDFVHPNLSTYKADDQEEEKKANDDEVSYDQKVSTPPDYELTEEEEENQEDDDVMGGEQEDEEDEELYRDLNLNLDKKDAEMTDAQTNQETEKVHVTLTTEPPVVQQQSSSVSSDLVSKFINPSSDTSIDSILNPNVQSDIPVNVSVSATTETPSFGTIIPQPPILIIQSQQQTHDSTTTITIPTTTLLEIPNFASLFGFERRVSSLETELKQTNQFAEALSSILGIVDNYLASKMKDAVNVAIIKDHVKAQVSKIMPKVEKYVTESLGAEVLARSSNQPWTSYAAAASLSEFDASKSQPKSSSKSAQAEEHGPRVDDLEEPLHQEFNTGNDDVLHVREIIVVDERLWNPSGSQTPDRE
ncbi:hypothetical protein Tco_0740798 [Tanacetum coccineum]